MLKSQKNLWKLTKHQMEYNGESWAFSKNFIDDISGIIKNNPNTYKKIERIVPLIVS